ncbi:hypothetical protein FZEAL_7519 [Fusarium zealandicum]|uniref:endo-polygalacturonase n=1 Tax=Fusarium zealandicum TaxID=1053134 RepID=A0A8H4XIE4_9HYPO|nr:hypothetical protein FZEAL_7519 [Fusarium zealandicum]
MFKFASALFLAALAGSAVAAPTAPHTNVTSACTFSGPNGASKASAAQASCATMVLSNVAVPAGETLDLGKLKDGTHVIFKGETTWGYKEWSGPLLLIGGNKITVEGAKGAILNGDGARWWDGLGANGGKTKPKFFWAHGLTDSSINNLYIKNTPVHAVSINGANGLTITDMTINDADGDDHGGHNTDGFDIGDSTGVVITGAKVYNQDDCVAVNSGKENQDITFSGGLCSGGHGLSIGSVGNRPNNVVDTVVFKNSVVKNSVQAIRVKTVKGATGSVSGVTYSGITMSNISKFGILIEQNYDAGDLRGLPTSGVPITDLTLKNISGIGGVSSDGTDVAIVCGRNGCSDWTWTNVKVSGGKEYGSCLNVPGVASCSN